MIFFNSSGILLQKPREEEKSITGTYHRLSVIAEVNRSYNRVWTTLACVVSNVFMIAHLLTRCMIVQGYLADENIETLHRHLYFSDLALYEVLLLLLFCLLVCSQY